MITYTIESIKTPPETVTGYRAAVARARELAAEYQPAWGVWVTRPDGSVAITVGWSRRTS